MKRRELIVAGKEKTGQHPPKVEIDEMRLRLQEEGPLSQHHFEGHQPLRQFFDQARLLAAPLVEASAPEFSLLMAEERQPFGPRHKFLPKNVIELETTAFDLILDETPKNTVHAPNSLWEEVQLELGIDVFCDDLRFVVSFKDDGAPIAKDGHSVIALASQPPDQAAITVGNVGDFKRGARKLQNPPLHQAERAPGDLDQFNHLYTLKTLLYRIATTPRLARSNRQLLESAGESVETVPLEHCAAGALFEQRNS
jgi:hypothetical protein